MSKVVESSAAAPLVQVRDLAKTFEVSAPWLKIGRAHV